MFSQTSIPAGTVSGIWQKEKSPYYIEGDIRIAYGDKLVIESGVDIIFTGYYKITVNGIFQAKGTQEKPIYFTPSDTSVGWHGIRFIEAENFSTLQNCVLRYGRAEQRPDDSLYNECVSDPNCDEFKFNGGAIFIYLSHPVIDHCTISENHGQQGGGICIMNHSNPVIKYCEIKKNTAPEGAGIFCSDSSKPLIENCSVTENFAGGMGGGIYLYNYSSAIIESCFIQNNSALARGGGIAFYTSGKPSVRNSSIISNSSTLGGGIYIDEFYNVYREQPGKIDVRITNVTIDNNSADYGGGIWLRDTQGEIGGITVSNNRALMGGGIHIEHNPQLLYFSSDNPSNIYMNYARIMGNDLFRLGGEAPIKITLDTFTVKYYSSLNAEPAEKFPLTIKNFKLKQVHSDLYVSPDGDDSNSGLSSSDPLRSLKIALFKILTDSSSPHTIYMEEGEYIFSETNDVSLLNKHKYVNLKGVGFTEVIFGTDRIIVLTPWWLTYWAMIIYISILLSVVITVWNVRMRRVRIKNELEREKFEAQKLHEVDELKNRFFANISHEFRTPLTLILGLAKKITEKTQDNTSREDAGIIRRNAKRLNGLVNQLLDLSKLESGNMTLQTSPVNIIPLLKGLVLSFASFAERKRINLKFTSDEEEIAVYADKDKIEKIATNLLSNAFKFTPVGGSIEFNVKKIDTDIEISVTDTGIGISAERLDKIFDRFYQVDSSHTREYEGTGLGLALTKELVELHRGQIRVESKEGKGSRFIVTIPLGKDHLKPEEIIETEIIAENLYDEIEEPTEDVPHKIKPEVRIKTEAAESLNSSLLLLIVEDNTDVRDYIKGNLEGEYRILEAVNGKDGLNQAVSCIPDLIISDVMMPEMNGFEMCEKIKNDERTSHIPVIMLTAKATNRDKIDGYKTGADDYVMKPFDAEVLKVRIDNLISQRERLREHFRKEGIMEIDNAEVKPIDKIFLQKALGIINKHISDETFSVDSFASEAAMSRSQLRRKLEALVGEAPSELIRKIRMVKAARLIEQNFGNISEIAAEVGYNNPANFARSFKAYFGVSPSDYPNSKK